MSDDWDISAFEDPAPSKSTPADSLLPKSVPNTTTSKRRLRYRPDVAVNGRKYRGRRVSRSDAHLDSRSLGLFEDSDVESEEKHNDGSKRADLSRNEQSTINDDDDDVDADADADAGGGLTSPMELDISGNGDGSLPNEVEQEERKIAERLSAVKRADEERASAVRNQKDMYDSSVNFRIRLEPLLSIVRCFPSSGQRNADDGEGWPSSEDVSKATNETISALEGLITGTEAALTASWPAESETLDDGSFERWRDSILNQWGRKVNDASGTMPKGGFKAFDTSITAQMRAAIATGKQLERTRRVKDEIAMLNGHVLEPGSHNIHFDDGEFYRTLLREIIEGGDAPGGGLRYAQLSKIGRIRKKKDLSYTKGKRIKYDVHEKMVGFLTPVPLPDPGPVDEIVANLFGKAGRSTN